jgi:hypothetical protein
MPAYRRRRAQDPQGRDELGNPVSATQRIAHEFDGWAPELTALITDSDTKPVVRSFHALPIAHKWNRVPASPWLLTLFMLLPKTAMEPIWRSMTAPYRFGKFAHKGKYG